MTKSEKKPKLLNIFIEPFSISLPSFFEYKSNFIDFIDAVGRRSWLCTNNTGGTSLNGSLSHRRGRGRFIVLGSSGECLPITRNILLPNNDNSLYSSCDSGSENYFSAKTSLDKENGTIFFLVSNCPSIDKLFFFILPEIDSDEEHTNEQTNCTQDLDKRYTLAEKLRAALNQSNGYSDSLDSSYAVGISISGSRNEDEGTRCA